MKKVSIYLLEDELLTRAALESTLVDLGYKVCGMQDDPELAINEIKALKPDLAILDINLKGESEGIEVAKNIDVPFIFLTAYNDKATISKALATEPFSYLIKPFADMQVYAAIELAIDKINSLNTTKNQFIFKDGHKFIKVDLNEIDYVRSDKNYLDVISNTKNYILRKSLSEFMDTLKSDLLCRVHRSYSVNLSKIESYNSNEVTISGKKIPVSRKYAEKLIAQLKLS